MERPPPGVRAIFDQAREIDSPGERAAFLDRMCADAPDVRGEVEALLRAGDDAGSFLETPAAGLAGELAAGSGANGARTGPAAPDGGESLDFLTPSDKPGAIGRLGHYEVLEVVGRGGMGVVLRAFDETLHRVVAVKVMATQLAASATARRRFTREARAAAAVTHDHVVTIHAVEGAGPLPYIVMQFVAGQSLQDRLDRTGPLPLAETLRIGMQTASGLAAAHAQGLVHRDVKPANILLENGVERVKLTDFGLARAADDASLTQSGTVAGTPAFMSPEQAEGKSVDPRSDLFSFGSVLYAMCTGRPPFRAGTSMGVLKRVCEETPTPIRDTNPEVPEWLVAVIEKLHAKNPAARFQSAAEVAERLGQHLAHVQHPSVAPLPVLVKSADAPAAPERPTRRGRRWAATAVVLVALFAVLGTTEASGVTKLRATILRVFTSDGTPVVEAGGTDGKLNAPPAPPVAKGEPGAFVLLTVGKERGFDTLAGAVQSAGDGDTIEIRGNGPFVVQPMNIAGTALTIRAGDGYRPVLRLSPEAVESFEPLLTTNASLRLEGLEVQAGRPTSVEVGKGRYGIFMPGGSLYLGNCRFVLPGRFCVQIPSTAQHCIVRNCELLAGGGVDGGRGEDLHCVIDNCVARTNGVTYCRYSPPQSRDSSIQITRSSIRSNYVMTYVIEADPKVIDKKAASALRVNASTTVFDVVSVLTFTQSARILETAPPLEPAEAGALLVTLVKWHDHRNVYGLRATALDWSRDGKQEPAHGPKTLREWHGFWGQVDANSLEGVVRFHEGSRLSKLTAAPEKLTPEDFRLHPDSAGYRAGKDGKDLGADVDLVGPGPAYERWKKTPAYQQWLGEIGQVKK